jgi:glycosyltransferase involved in cell wall biosynthesis
MTKSIKKFSEKGVSIVIPTFNRAHFLPETIESCLNQSIPCEIIVCDHGSTDGTSELMLKYQERVKYIRREIDFGPHYCWLEGILNSSNNLIHIQFDDDWIDPLFIEKCIAVYSDEVAFVFSGATVVNNEEGTSKPLEYKNWYSTGIHRICKVQRKILAGHLISPAACLFRKEELLTSIYQGEIPLARTSYRGVGPDILFSLIPFLKYSYVGVVSEDLAYFRAHSDSISIDSLKDKTNKLSKAYIDARIFYLVLALFNKLKLYNIVRTYLAILRRLEYIYNTKN